MAIQKTFETAGPSKFTVIVSGEIVSTETSQIADAGEVDDLNRSDRFAAHYANRNKPQERHMPNKWVLACRPIRHLSWWTPKRVLIEWLKQAEAKEIEAIKEIQQLRKLLEANGIQ